MNVIDYFNVLESENRWKNDYGMLHFESYEMASQLHTSSAKSEQNRGKNRYVDVLPFDETRVKLKSPQDYINASHVKPPFVDIEYICSQVSFLRGPGGSSGIFWSVKFIYQLLVDGLNVYLFFLIPLGTSFDLILIRMYAVRDHSHLLYI